jgi:hypothetical protein
MALVYTRRLGAITVTTAVTWTEIFRASSGKTTVLRDLIVTNASTAAITELAIRVRPLTKAGDWWMYYAKPFPIGTVRVDMRQVIEPGEAVEIHSAATGVFAACTGYVFE